MMTARNPFRTFIGGGIVFVVLVAAFDAFVVLAHLDSETARSVVIIGAALALAAVIAIVAMAIIGRRYSQRMRQILAGDYFVRWQYAQDEWQQFAAQERMRAIRAALIFLPLLLALAILLAVLGALTSDSTLTSSIVYLFILATAFLIVLIIALARRGSYARRPHRHGDTYISRLGILYPNGFRPLQGIGYRLAAVDMEQGTPSRLRFRIRFGRMVSLLAFLGNAPAQYEVRVPVPYGHEAEAAQIAAQLARAGLLRR